MNSISTAQSVFSTLYEQLGTVLLAPLTSKDLWRSMSANPTRKVRYHIGILVRTMLCIRIPALGPWGNSSIVRGWSIAGCTGEIHWGAGKKPIRVQATLCRRLLSAYASKDSLPRMDRQPQILINSLMIQWP